MNEVKGYINTKNISILFLSITAVFFCWKWISSTDGLKVKNKMLEDKVTMIQVERDSLAKDRAYLVNGYDSLSSVVVKESVRYNMLKNELKVSKLDLEKAKSISDSYKSKYDSIDVNIKNLRKSPINRTGDKLINSLKNKLN